ncbi:tapasin-related protein isoform X1 [Caretta caretta]|uniref:tapasin-related protein isoform X1 n=2 Tax=Caretta caretta TaxID=8467 RepID=UPI003D4B41D7
MALRIVLLLWLGSAGSPMTTSSRAPNAASPSVKAPTETNRSLELPPGGIRAAGAFPVSTDPSPVTALLGSDVLLTCSFPVALRGAGEGDGQLRVTWYFQGQALMELDGIAVTTRKGAELFAPELPRGNASLLLPHITLAEQGPYRCSVRYGGQRGEGTVRLRVAALPRVEVPSPVVQREEDSALVCCVRGFYPQDIAVSWLRDGQELNASFVSAAHRGHRDETFSLVSVYSFTPTEQDLGALFSCRARHPALNQSRQADFRITFRGPEEQRGLLEPGLRILLWTLRGALLLAMALGGWSCYCSGRRHGQVREWIWTPRRWRSPWGAARGSGRGTGGAVPAERLEKGIPVSTAHGAACASRLVLTGGPRLNC